MVGGRLARNMLASLATLLTGCLAVAPPPIAVRSRETTTWWGGVGVGAASSGFLAQLDLTRASERRVLRTRFSAHTNLGGGWNTSEPPESVTELSVLAGRGDLCCSNNWGAWDLGVGLVHLSSGWHPEHREVTTIGVTGEAMLVSARVPHISATLFANANTEKSFAGLSLSLLLGRMPFTTMQPPMRRRPPF